MDALRMNKLLSVLIAVALALCVITVGLAAWRFYGDGDPHAAVANTDLSLTLKGEKEICLEVGQKYLEPGSLAIFTSSEVTAEVPVTVKGQVDTTRIGDYTLEYFAQIGDLICTDSRLVHIVDTQKPVISLISNPDGFTLIGHAYEEEGFTASDNYDGDITDQVTREEVGDTIVYTVTDSSGNTFSVTRTINYFDPGKPTIHLLGNSTTLLIQGDAYTDPGVIATDANDGDVTASVAVEGSVDTTKSGIYTLRYTATNRYGFSGSAERTVYVLPPELVPLRQGVTTDAPVDSDDPENPVESKPTIRREDYVIPVGGMAYKPTGKVIYLTFDDGPSYHTPRLLSILRKYQVKASFFVVQNSLIDIIAQTASEGHTVAIHTSSHNYKKIYTNEDAFLADLLAMQQVIEQYTGQTVMLNRFPGGSSNTISSAYSKGIMSRLTKLLPQMGYTYFDWNVDSNDAGGASTPEEVFKNIINGVQWYKQSVVLQHDTNGFSVDAVERLIVWGLINGYTFQPLTADSPTCHHSVFN